MKLYLLEKGDKLTYPQMNLAHKSEGNLVVADRRIQLHRSGKFYVSYLYDGLMEALIAEMHQNIEDHLDNLIVIYGPEGIGKSHLGYQIAKAFNPDFDLKRNYIYEYDEFLKRITEDINSPPGTVYWLDEASNVASNRDWMHTDNKEFIKVLEMFRSRGWTLILCIPKLDRLDLYIRETRARYILRAAIMNWEGRTNKKRGFVHLTRVDFTNDFRSEKKIGYMAFQPIPEPDLSVYEDLKLQSQTKKIQELNDMKEAKEAGGNRLAKLGKNNRTMMLELVNAGYSYEAIAGMQDITVESVRNAVCKAKKEAGIR